MYHAETYTRYSNLDEEFQCWNTAQCSVGGKGYSADYSIGRFRFLRRLLLVRSAKNYYRMCRLILCSFYKNITHYIMGLWFTLYSAWSGQILFERWTIVLYIVLLTALPPALGILTVCLKAALKTSPWTWLSLLAIGGSVITLFFFFGVYR